MLCNRVPLSVYFNRYIVYIHSKNSSVFAKTGQIHVLWYDSISYCNWTVYFKTRSSAAVWTPGPRARLLTVQLLRIIVFNEFPPPWAHRLSLDWKFCADPDFGLASWWPTSGSFAIQPRGGFSVRVFIQHTAFPPDVAPVGGVMLSFG